MKLRSKLCRECIYSHPTYGNIDRRGRRTVSHFFCVERNGKLKKNSNLKQCPLFVSKKDYVPWWSDKK